CSMDAMRSVNVSSRSKRIACSTLCSFSVATDKQPNAQSISARRRQLSHIMRHNPPSAAGIDGLQRIFFQEIVTPYLEIKSQQGSSNERHNTEKTHHRQAMRIKHRTTCSGSP